MEKIKVFLRLGKRPHPSVYDNFLDYPPKGVLFKYPPILKSSKEKTSWLHNLKVRLWLKYIKDRPPIVPIIAPGCNLIHTTNNIMNSSNTPWLMDVELLLGLMSFDPANLNKPYFKKVKKVLMKNSCKKLLPYTEAAKKSMIYGGLADLESKMDVLYLCRKAVKDFKKPRNKIPIILWVGRRFLEKGGKTVLQVYEEMDGKFDFRLIMRGPVPEEYKKKYGGRKNIEFSDTKDYVSDNIWETLYKNADIFLYPTNLDSFGNAFLDAMNYKIPVVSGDIFSVPEIVENGRTGFLVHHPNKWHDEKFQMNCPSFDAYVKSLENFYDKRFVRELAEKVELLIKNPHLRKKMGEAGRKEIVDGKFSIKRRQEELLRLYREALEK